MYECTEQYTHTTEAKGCVSCNLKFHASSDHQTAAFTIEFSTSRPRYLMLVWKLVHMCEVKTWHWDNGIELFCES